MCVRSRHTFPSADTCCSVFVRRKETRRINLTFNIPVAMPLSFACRIIDSDDTYVTLQDVYDQSCARAGFNCEAASLAYCMRTGSRLCRTLAEELCVVIQNPVSLR